MALIHRALLTWFTVLVFLIFLVLKLERRLNWNWFLVFVPLWFFDAVLLMYIARNMGRYCKDGCNINQHDITLKTKVFFWGCALLKVSFKVRQRNNINKHSFGLLNS